MHNTIVYSHHQNLTYFKKAVSLNRRKARWAEELISYKFNQFYHKGSSNHTSDILSRCPALTSRDGGTPAAGPQTLLRKEQWVDIGTMQLDNNNPKEINIGAIAIEQLLPEAKERIKENALLDEGYIAICKLLSSGGKIDEHYEIQDRLLCWKNRLYSPKGLGKRIMNSERNSGMAGHFGRERTMELPSRNFYWPNMEMDIRKYCNQCNNCQRMKAPRHAKHGLLHPIELSCKPWTHISTNFITDLPESESVMMILVIVDRFTKMAHFIPLKKKDSPTVARAYLENIWKYHGFAEDVVSDRDGTFTSQFFTELYYILDIKRSMSTAYHPQSDGQTEPINHVIEHFMIPL